MKRLSIKGVPHGRVRFKFEYQTSAGGYASIETNAGVWLTPDEAEEQISTAVEMFKQHIAAYRGKTS
jgi:hypothetical protein